MDNDSQGQAGALFDNFEQTKWGKAIEMPDVGSIVIRDDPRGPVVFEVLQKIPGPRRLRG